jgi:hypothetical protein
MKGMPKQEKIIIRTPFPTNDEVAAMIGLTPQRRAEIERLYEKVNAKMEAEDRRKRARRKPSKKNKR